MLRYNAKFNKDKPMCFNQIFTSSSKTIKFINTILNSKTNKKLGLHNSIKEHPYFKSFIKNYSKSRSVDIELIDVSKNKTLENTYFKTSESAIFLSCKVSMPGKRKRFSLLFVPEKSIVFTKDIFSNGFGINIFKPCRHNISGYIYSLRFLIPFHLPLEMHLSNYDGYFKPYEFTEEKPKNNTYFGVPNVKKIGNNEKGYYSIADKSSYASNTYTEKLPHNKNMLFIGEEADKFTLSYLDKTIVPQTKYTKTLYVIPIKKDMDVLAKK